MLVMTFSAFVELANFAAGHLDPKSCTTITWLEDGIGPNRSTATTSQFFFGELYVEPMVLQFFYL